jgi:hypothetical protein
VNAQPKTRFLKVPTVLVGFWVIVLFELLIMPLKNSISVIKIDEFHSCGNQELPTQQEKNYAAHVENMKGTG